MDEEKQKSEDREFNNILVNAFINTKLELDKNILTLSTAGIGAAIAFASAHENSKTQFAIFLIATLVFISVIVMELLIFKYNGDYILDIHNNQKPESKESVLLLLDRFVAILFVLAICLTLALGVSHIKVSGSETECEKLSNQNKAVDMSNLDRRSLAGLHNLKPQQQPQQTSGEGSKPQQNGEQNKK